MLVDDLDVGRAGWRPGEAEPELVVDLDGILALAIAFQSLQAVGGRRSQVLQRHGGVQHVELAERDRGDVAERLALACLEQSLRFAGSERLDRHRAQGSMANVIRRPYKGLVVRRGLRMRLVTLGGKVPEGLSGPASHYPARHHAASPCGTCLSRSSSLRLGASGRSRKRRSADNHVPPTRMTNRSRLIYWTSPVEAAVPKTHSLMS